MMARCAFRKMVSRKLLVAAVILRAVTAPLRGQAVQPSGKLISRDAIAVNPANGDAYAVDSAAGLVNVIHSQSVVPVKVGKEPIAIAVNSRASRVYILNSGSSSVSVLDSHADRVVATVDVGPLPYAIAVNTVTDKIYVSRTFNDDLTIIDGKTLKTSLLKIGSADAIAIDSTIGRIYLLGYESSNLAVLNEPDRSISKIATGIHPWAMAIDERTHKLYVTLIGNAAILAIDEVSGAHQPCGHRLDSLCSRHEPLH